MILGRSSRCDIQLPFRVVSSHHLTFEKRGDNYVVCDEGSTNGTEVGGEMLESGAWIPVEEGLELRIVNVTITAAVERTPADDVDAFTLAHTGTLARELLGDALEENEEELAFFEVVGGPQRGERFFLPDDLEQSAIGSGPNCIVELDGEGIAEEAVAIEYDERGFVISPTGQTVVWHNDSKLSGEAPLSSDDRVAFDQRDLVFHDPLQSQLAELDGLPGMEEVSTELQEDADSSAGDIEATPQSELDGGDTASDDLELDGKSNEEPNVDQQRSQSQTGPEPQGGTTDTGWGLVETVLLLLTLLFVLLVVLILLVTFGVV